MKKLTIVTEMADGSTLESSTALPDYMLFERTAKKHGWSTTPGENPVVWETFLAWASLRRLKLYEGTWEAFIGGEAVNVDAKVPEKVPPTPSEVGIESS
jgi:hypothetical protein